MTEADRLDHARGYSAVGEGGARSRMRRSRLRPSSAGPWSAVWTVPPRDGEPVEVAPMRTGAADPVERGSSRGGGSVGGGGSAAATWLTCPTMSLPRSSSGRWRGSGGSAIRCSARGDGVAGRCSSAVSAGPRCAAPECPVSRWQLHRIQGGGVCRRGHQEALPRPGDPAHRYARYRGAL